MATAPPAGCEWDVAFGTFPTLIIFVASQYEEVNAEQLQRLLNDQILKGLESTCVVQSSVLDSFSFPLQES